MVSDSDNYGVDDSFYVFKKVDDDNADGGGVDDLFDVYDDDGDDDELSIWCWFDAAALDCTVSSGVC